MWWMVGLVVWNGGGGREREEKMRREQMVGVQRSGVVAVGGRGDNGNEDRHFVRGVQRS
jgi:hypothetical protein